MYACVVLTFQEAEPKAELTVKTALQNLFSPDQDRSAEKWRFLTTLRLTSASGNLVDLPVKFSRIASPLYPYAKANKAWEEIMQSLNWAAMKPRMSNPLAERYLAQTAVAPVQPSSVVAVNATSASEYAPGWRLDSPESDRLVETAKDYREAEQLLARANGSGLLAQHLYSAYREAIFENVYHQLLELIRKEPAALVNGKQTVPVTDQQKVVAALRSSFLNGKVRASQLARAFVPLVDRGVEEVLTARIPHSAIAERARAEWKQLGKQERDATTVLVGLLARRTLQAQSAGEQHDRATRSTEAQLNPRRRAADPEALKNPSFSEIVGRFSQHPGIMRGLWLTHDCELDLTAAQAELKYNKRDEAVTCLGNLIDRLTKASEAELAMGSAEVRDIENGRGSLTSDVTTVTTFVTVGIQTGAGYFRAQPLPSEARALSNVFSLRDNEGSWLVDQLLPPNVIAVSQEDGMSLAASGNTNVAQNARSDTAPHLQSEGWAFRWAAGESAVVADDRLANARKDTRPSKGKNFDPGMPAFHAEKAHQDLLQELDAYQNTVAKWVKGLDTAMQARAVEGGMPELMAAIAGTEELQRARQTVLEKMAKARQTGFYAEDLMRGLAIEGRRVYESQKGSPPPLPWHRLCKRRVALINSKGVPLLDVGEEGFVSSTTNQAAPPITGIVRKASSLLVKADVPTLDQWKDRSLQVDLLVSDPEGTSMGPGPEQTFWLTDPTNLTQPKPEGAKYPFAGKTQKATVVRCLIRARPGLDDITGGEIVDSHAGPAGDRVRLRVLDSVFDPSKEGLATEVTVSPVFTTQGLNVPSMQDANKLGFQTATNAARNEAFNFLFSHTGTGYINSNGNAVDLNPNGGALPDEFKHFIAEGERRFYSLGLPARSDVVAEGNPRRLGDDEREQIVKRQAQSAAQSKTPWVSTLVQAPEWPDFFLAVGIQDSPDDLLRDLPHPFFPNFSGQGEPELAWRELLPGSGVQAIRGPVRQLVAEAAGLAVPQGGTVTLAGTPNVQFPASLLPGLKSTGQVVRVGGTFTLGVGGLTLNSDGFSGFVLPQNIDSAVPSDEVRQLQAHRALSIVATIEGPAERDVGFDIDFQARSFTKKPVDFVAPLDLQQGQWIEAVATGQGARLTARGWPRLPVATLDDTAARVIVFADGRTRRVTASSDSTKTLVTGRVNYREFNDAHHDSVSSATIVLQEPFRLRGELRSLEAADANHLSLELALTGTPKKTVRVLAADSDLVAEAIGTLAPRRVDSLETGDFIIVRADAVPSPAGSTQASALFRPLVGKDLMGKDALEMAAGLRGQLAVRRASAKEAIAQGGADFQPGGVTTGEGFQREFWAPTVELTPVDGKEVIAYVPPFALLRRVIAVSSVVQPLRTVPKDKPLSEPIHAGVSDILVRWSGWSLGVQLPGEPDVSPAPADSTRWRLEVRPPEKPAHGDPPLRSDYDWRELPLRHGVSYEFRFWVVDFAGNNGSDPEVFQLPPPNRDDGVIASPPYERPTEVQAPAIAFKPSLDRGLDPVSSLSPDTPLFLPGDLRNVPVAWQRLRDNRPESNALRAYFPAKTWAYLVSLKAREISLPENRALLLYGLNECLRAENLPTIYAGDKALQVRLAPHWSARAATTSVPGDGTVEILWENRRLLEQYFGKAVLDVAPRGPARQHRLLVLTLSSGGTWPQTNEAALTVLESTCQLLPPPCSEEVLMATGQLDRRERKWLKQLFAVRRLHAVPGYLTKASGFSPQLSYLPDPGASELLALTEANLPPWTLFVWDGEQYQRQPLLFGKPDDFASWGAKILDLKDGDRQPITLKGTTIYLPRGRRSVAYLDRSQETRAGNTQEARTVPDEGTSARLELFHAVTEPLARPQLTRWELTPMRQLGDTGQRLQGAVEIDQPSTGAVTVVANWNEYWDEAVTTIQVAARAQVQVEGGSVAKVILLKGPDGKTLAGAGFGSEVIVHIVEPGQPSAGCLGGRFLLAPRPFLTEQAVACLVGQGEAEAPMLAKFSVRLRENKVETVEVLQGGKGYGPPQARTLDALILQRPPFVEEAQASCTVDSHGAIDGFTFAKNEFGEEKRGGFYVDPPVVWLEDPKGTGRDAEILAILDGYGEIGVLHIVNKGHGYSPETRVRINTHRFAFPEISIPLADPTAAALPGIVPTGFAIDLLHAFGDPLHHSVDYFLQASSSFREIFRDRATEPVTGVTWRAWESLVQRSEIPAAQLPARPEASSLWLSCRVVTARPSAAGTYHVTFEHAIRVYLQRPWRAEEQLAVLTGLAEVNEVTGHGDWLRLAFETRQYVSEWAFDPAWLEFSLPPLHTDRFGGAIQGRLPFAYPPPNDVSSAQPNLPPVTAVLYQVEWDAVRQEWYADVYVGGPIGGPVFIKLAIARCQRETLPGLNLSPVETLDMVSFPGHRQLDITFAQKGRWQLRVAGDLGGVRQKEARGFAERLIFVELRRGSSPPATGPAVQQAPRKPGEPLCWTASEEASPPIIQGDFFHGDAALDTLVLVESRREPGVFMAVTPAEWERVLEAGNAAPGPSAGSEPYLIIREGILRENLSQQGKGALRLPPLPNFELPTYLDRKVPLDLQLVWSHAVPVATVRNNLST